jgi:preprotein translocase subunit SecD
VSGSIRWKVIWVSALLVLFAFVSAANFIPKADRVDSAFWPDDGLRLGLDLRGGIHWVVGVQLDNAIKQELEFVRKSIGEQLDEDGVVLESSTVENLQLTLVPNALEDRAAVEAIANDTAILDVVDDTDGALVYALDERWTDEVRERTMAQVVEVLRRRIDDPQRGVPDSVITRQGRDRVMVQIPGEQIDRERARELLKSTGFLEFKIVEDADDSEELLKARFPDGYPPGMMIVKQTDLESGLETGAFLVPKVPAMTGASLEHAQLSFDQQQRPIVEFRFNPEGGTLFGEITEANKGKRLAIILDKNVYSAPSIRSRITTRGMIEGQFTSEEAADLAVILRAGSLSVPVVIEEERTVGPGLGQDSIESGAMACVVGLFVVLAFVAGYYRLSGGFASIALLANLVLLMGLMSLFEATLTLPGIAGLVLTVGMAVDANVIIFERIREELRAGRSIKAAINTGFSKATWTVLDANITTLITAVILFQWGTGPIKGFAVTLSVGIVTSVFAALVVTRLLFQLYPGTRNVSSLSI